SDVPAVMVRENGRLVMSFPSLNIWDADFGLTFYQIEFPENLEVVSNGIYRTTLTTGTIVSGTLGTGTFSEFSLSVENSSVFLIDVELTIDAPDNETIFHGSFRDVLPGSK